MSSVQLTSTRAQIIPPQSLFEGEPSGLEKVTLPFEPCEAQVIRYAKGQSIPLHSHSGQTMKIVLSGRLMVADDEGVIGEVGAGDIYVCIDSYEVVALEETLMMLLQAPGTVRI